MTYALLTYRPPTPVALLDVLTVEQKRERMQAYAGNVQWSILAALYGLGGSQLRLPSYGEYAAMLDGAPPKDPESEAEEVKRHVDRMIEMFLPEEVSTPFP